jgi:hypothetical protein
MAETSAKFCAPPWLASRANDSGRSCSSERKASFDPAFLIVVPVAQIAASAPHLPTSGSSNSNFGATGFISLSCFGRGFLVGAMTLPRLAVQEPGPIRSDPPSPLLREHARSSQPTPTPLQFQECGLTASKNLRERGFLFVGSDERLGDSRQPKRVRTVPGSSATWTKLGCGSSESPLPNGYGRVARNSPGAGLDTFPKQHTPRGSCLCEGDLSTAILSGTAWGAYFRPDCPAVKLLQGDQNQGGQWFERDPPGISMRGRSPVKVCTVADHRGTQKPSTTQTLPLKTAPSMAR